MCRFLLMGCMLIICKNFFAELVHSVSLTTENGSKQRFSLLKEKVVI